MKTRICNVVAELPKLTMAVNMRLQEMDDVEEKFKNREVKADVYYQAMYDLIKDLVDEETVCQILAGDNIDEIDLQNLAIALIDVREAYLKPVEQHKLESFRNDWKTMAKETQGITELLGPLSQLNK